MAINNLDIFKTKRQKKEYIRMVNQLNFIENWINKNSYILKKNCTDSNIETHQLYRHYIKKANNLRKNVFR